jgi:hypothetical protein
MPPPIGEEKFERIVSSFARAHLDHEGKVVMTQAEFERATDPNYWSDNKYDKLYKYTFADVKDDVHYKFVATWVGDDKPKNGDQQNILINVLPKGMFNT